MINIHAIINKYVDLYEKKYLIERIETLDNNIDELKKSKLTVINHLIGEYLNTINIAISEFDEDQLNNLSKRINADINLLNKTIETAKINIQTYEKEIDKAISANRYNSIENYISMIASKCLILEHTNRRINAYSTIHNYINTNQNKQKIK